MSEYDDIMELLIAIAEKLGIAICSKCGNPNLASFGDAGNHCLRCHP
jgi:hypothetical protein